MNPAEGSASRAHYEALRQQAVGGSGILAAEPLGAILVVKSGVAGWLQQWQQVAGAILVAPAESRRPARPPNTPGWQRDLTLLLAQMSARHLRPALPL
jgi:predicted alpha/beta hydrolase family esterase